MTQVTQLIIRPSQDQTRNLVLAIIDVARKQSASQDTLSHIRTLATEVLDLLVEAKPDEMERRNFEKWAEEVCALPWGYLRKRRTEDGYTERDYTHIWHGWKARSEQEAT